MFILVSNKSIYIWKQRTYKYLFHSENVNDTSLNLTKTETVLFKKIEITKKTLVKLIVWQRFRYNQTFSPEGATLK